jgi:hypothetical protein
MDGEMEHHSVGNGQQDHLDCPFDMAIVMVLSTSFDISNHFLEAINVSAESNQGKQLIVVQQEALWDDAMVSTH